MLAAPSTTQPTSCACGGMLAGMAGFYRALAYAVPSMVVANASGGLMLLFLSLTNGFMITR